jgi:NADH:ubiquinone oxidoreductase subunit 6 (subunit J)
MTLALILIVLFTLGVAAVAMSLRNLIHAVLLLIGSWLGVAAFYLWAGAEFVAFAQVIVYVGAVSMVVLFAVLLTRHSRDDLAAEPDSMKRASSALIAGGAMAGVLVGAVTATPLQVAPKAAPTVTVLELGQQLMGPHVASLLAIGALLTVALLGAVVIASHDKPEDNP